MTWGELVWWLIPLSMLVTIGAGLIAGGWWRVAALAIVSGFIGAWVAVSVSVPTVGGEPEDQWNIAILGFILGMIPGAWFGVAINWLATKLGRHTESAES